MLGLAAQLGVRSVPVAELWQGALARAIDSGASVYNSVFVELAAREDVELATFDGPLQRRFPEIAKRPDDCV